MRATPGEMTNAVPSCRWLHAIACTRRTESATLASVSAVTAKSSGGSPTSTGRAFELNVGTRDQSCRRRSNKPLPLGVSGAIRSTNSTTLDSDDCLCGQPFADENGGRIIQTRSATVPNPTSVPANESSHRMGRGTKLRRPLASRQPIACPITPENRTAKAPAAKR